MRNAIIYASLNFIAVLLACISGYHITHAETISAFGWFIVICVAIGLAFVIINDIIVGYVMSKNHVPKHAVNIIIRGTVMGTRPVHLPNMTCYTVLYSVPGEKHNEAAKTIIMSKTPELPKKGSFILSRWKNKSGKQCRLLQPITPELQAAYAKKYGSPIPKPEATRTTRVKKGW